MAPATQTIEWSESYRGVDSPERTRFLEQQLELVRYLAQRLVSRLPKSVDVEDLVHDGVVGLLDAVEKFDARRGVRFRTYAESRVRGAMLDALRRRDWRTRSAREAQRALGETIERLTAERGRPATEEEIADTMGLDMTRCRRVLQDASAGSVLSLEDLPTRAQPVAQREGAQPHSALERRELLSVLADEITNLPQRERRVVELYYREELRMKEIGVVLGITESRVCQLHAQAAARLRAAIRARLHASPPAAATAGLPRKPR